MNYALKYHPLLAISALALALVPSSLGASTKDSAKTAPARPRQEPARPKAQAGPDAMAGFLQRPGRRTSPTPNRKPGPGPWSGPAPRLREVLLPAGAPDLGPGHGWERRSTWSSEGVTHTRWDHVYRGLPVLGSQMITHRLAHGGFLEPTPSLALGRGAGGHPFAPPIPGGLEPAVSREAAVQAVLDPLGPLRRLPGIPFCTLALLPRLDQVDMSLPGEVDAAGFPFVVTDWRLVWRLETRWRTGGFTARDAEYLVDAHSGEVLQARPVASRMAGTGQTLLYGQVELGTTYDPLLGFQLRDTRRAGNRILRAKVTVDREDFKSWHELPVTSPVNHWGDGRPDDLLSVAASAAYALQSTWDYFGIVHGWHGADGRGTPVDILLEVPDSEDNAQWSQDTEGRLRGGIQIGPGRYFWPVTDLETLGHEFAHGVNRASANLKRGPESPGLDEGGADFFGQMVATWARHGGGRLGRTRLPADRIGDRGTSWLYTSRLSGPAPEGMHGVIDLDGQPTKLDRNLFEPSLLGDPEAWSPDLFRDWDEHKVGVPLSRALYFLCRGAEPWPGAVPGAPSGALEAPHHSRLLPGGMAGLGNDHAARLWFRALTAHLQPFSGYFDAREAMLRAARELHPGTPAIAQAVAQAFAAIGVGKPTLAPSGPAATGPMTLHATPSGADVVLGVDVANPRAVTWVTFLVDDVPVGRSLVPPFRLTLPASRTLANGTHAFRALVRDLDDHVTDTASLERRTFDLTNPVQQLLRDPSLEGMRGFLPNFPFLIQRPEPGQAHSGDHCAEFRLRPEVGSREQKLYQEVDLPAGHHLRLQFHLRARAGTGPGAGDPLILQVLDRSDGASPVATHMEVFRPGDTPDAWSPRFVDLDAFAGRKVVVRFGFKPGEGSTTVFRLDDILLHASREPLPAPEGPPERKEPAPAPEKKEP